MGTFNVETELSHKFVENYTTLMMVVTAYRALNHTIVATIGSFDLLHIGHLRYLRQAGTFGSILVVGADTDEAIRLYKGPLRPIVPFRERVEMLTYQEGINLVTGVPDVDSEGRWKYGLIKAIRPDVFVAVEGSYPPQQIRDIRRYCDKVKMLPRQAEDTSTSGFIEKTVKTHLKDMKRLGKNTEKRKE